MLRGLIATTLAVLVALAPGAGLGSDECCASRADAVLASAASQPTGCPCDEGSGDCQCGCCRPAQENRDRAPVAVRVPAPELRLIGPSWHGTATFPSCWRPLVVLAPRPMWHGATAD